MAERTVRTRDEAIFGTPSVFSDLGYANVEERQTKLQLACAVAQIIEDRVLTQAAAAELLGINQPKISALLRYKLDGFSVERLMTFLTSLDRDVSIVIKKRPRARSAGRINVVAE
jgi:predicted XRE-type DNA-binding protein